MLTVVHRYADFFYSYAGIFHGYAGRFTQKSSFSPKNPQTDFFSSYDGFWDFFYAYDGFFYGRNGHFGEFRAHSILQLRWKSQGFEISIVTVEKPHFPL
jgi:hypothetical protein